MIRYLCIILRAFLSRRSMGGLDESVVTMRVWPTDLGNIAFLLVSPWIRRRPHMNNPRYLFLMDVGRIDHHIRTAKNQPGILRTLARRKMRALVGGIIIEYKKPLLLFQKYQLRTRGVCWDEKWAYYEQRFEREGAVMAIVFSRLMLLGPAGKIPASEVSRALGTPPVSPPFPPAVEHWRQSNASLTKG